MTPTRRDFIKAAAAAATLGLPGRATADQAAKTGKTHIVSLSFDDGFKKSFVRTAEIYERHKLSACLNVIAAGHRSAYQAPGKYIAGSSRGDFALWNELQERGHEVMPHGYKHANLRQLPFKEAKDLILRCLDVFSKELEGFDPKRAVFNFPYNASTPELEKWLPSRVKAFRTGGGAINRLPHKGQVKLTCTSFGPGNCEKAIDREIQKLLARDSGWLIFNTHGLDNEGWGPIRATYLERLLQRLTAIDTVDVLPVGKALSKYAGKENKPNDRKKPALASGRVPPRD